MWRHCPGRPAAGHEPSDGGWESQCGPSRRRIRHRYLASEADGTLRAISWRRWSSDFLPVPSGVLATVSSRRIRRLGQLEQTVVDQPFHVLPDGSLLHAVETFAGEGKEQE